MIYGSIKNDPALITEVVGESLYRGTRRGELMYACEDSWFCFYDYDGRWRPANVDWFNPVQQTKGHVNHSDLKRYTKYEDEATRYHWASAFFRKAKGTEKLNEITELQPTQDGRLGLLIRLLQRKACVNWNQTSIDFFARFNLPAVVRFKFSDLNYGWTCISPDGTKVYTWEALVRYLLQN